MVVGLSLNSLPGTLVAGYPGQAEGNLARTPRSRCQGGWGPHQVWRALESQQELMVAPVGLEGGLDSVAGCSGRHGPLHQRDQCAHKPSVPR